MLADQPGPEARLERLGRGIAPAGGQGRVPTTQVRVLARHLDHRSLGRRPGSRGGHGVVGVTLGRDHHGEPLGPALRRRVRIEIPPDHESVGAVPGVDLVAHLAVERPSEVVGHRSELAEVEPGVPRHERIEGPPSHVDVSLQRLGPLTELQRVAHAPMAPLGQRGEHVRVHVEAVIVHARPTEDEADKPVAVVGPERCVAAVRERGHQFARRQLERAPRGHHNPGRVVELAERGQRSELHVRRIGRGAGEIPGRSRLVHAGESSGARAWSRETSERT